MEDLFNAIGFSNIDLLRNELRYLRKNYDKVSNFIDDGKSYVEYYKCYGKDFGLCLRGRLNEKGKFYEIESFPYFNGSTKIDFNNFEYYESYNNTNENCFYIEEESTGNEIVFKLLNANQYFRKITKKNKLCNVSLSGLSMKGTVLLPIVKDITRSVQNQQKLKNKLKLQRKAREGDKEAQEKLEKSAYTIEEIIKKDLGKEDFFTIMDEFFIGLEELEMGYSILGDIVHVEEVINSLTLEECYILRLDVTGTKMDLIINRSNLEGVPKEGNRFVGNCILQGTVLFNKK